MRHVGGNRIVLGWLLAGVLALRPLPSAANSLEAPPATSVPVPAVVEGLASVPGVGWLQWVVGADLAREVVARAGVARVGVAIVDAGFRVEAIAPQAHLPGDESLTAEPGSDQGDRLANLIFDPSFGVSSAARLVKAVPVGRLPVLSRYAAGLETAASSPARVLLVGRELGDHPAILSALAEFAVAGGITVLPAGDRFPRPLREGLALAPAVRVGAIGDSGFVALGSQEDAEVDIAAPGGLSLRSVVYENGQRLPKPCEGTACASALVAGAIANAVALLPGITLSEVKLLLSRTALPTVNAKERIRRNGAGLLNAYRMVEVATRLAPQWPGSRARLSNGERELYDFEAVAATIERDAALRASTARLEPLRRAFLLSPTTKRAAALMQALAAHGHADAARFLRSMTEDVGAMVREQFADESSSERQLEAIRAAASLGIDDILSAVIDGDIAFVDGANVHGARARDRVVVALAVSRGKSRNLAARLTGAKHTVPRLIELASLSGRRDVVLDLVRHARPGSVDITPAVIAGDMDIVRSLLAAGAPVEGPMTRGAATPLMAVASAPWNHDMAELLVQAGAQLDREDSRGETALTSAISRGDERLAEVLLAAGANPLVGKARGRTPLELAQSKGLTRVVQALCVRGVDAPSCRSVRASVVASVTTGTLP